MNQSNHVPSLFEHGQIGSGFEPTTLYKDLHSISLIDLLYDGFYIVFLLKNGYVPQDLQQFREKILSLLAQFEQQAKRINCISNDIQDAKYAFCALLDETIVTQTNPDFFTLQNNWLSNPLQLKLFGSQLAGDHFFESLEQLRIKGKERLASLEIFYYCLLLGFQGKYRIDSIEHLNHLRARLGDEIEFLKGSKTQFSPYAALPDQIKNIIHKELPFLWILLFLLAFTLLSFAGLHYRLAQNDQAALSQFNNVISSPAEQANITIHLP